MNISIFGLCIEADEHGMFGTWQNFPMNMLQTTDLQVKNLEKATT